MLALAFRKPGRWQALETLKSHGIAQLKSTSTQLYCPIDTFLAAVLAPKAAETKKILYVLSRRNFWLYLKERLGDVVSGWED